MTAICQAPGCGAEIKTRVLLYRARRGIVSGLCCACAYRAARLTVDRKSRRKNADLEAALAAAQARIVELEQAR